MFEFFSGLPLIGKIIVGVASAVVATIMVVKHVLDGNKKKNPDQAAQVVAPVQQPVQQYPSISSNPYGPTVAPEYMGELQLPMSGVQQFNPYEKEGVATLIEYDAVIPEPEYVYPVHNQSMFNMVFGDYETGPSFANTIERRFVNSINYPQQTTFCY
jgi:hypothetical protein